MPVMGPNLDSARSRGNDVAQKLLEDLLKNHDLFDITEDRYKNFGLGNSKERWRKAKDTFIKAVEELFIEDACNSF